MLAVLPVAEPGQVTVRAAFAGVLRGGLPVHLQHSAAGSPEHAAEQDEVVHLHGGGGRLMGLVDALQHRAQQPARRPSSVGRRGDVVGGIVRRSRLPIRRCILDPLERVRRSRRCARRCSPGRPQPAAMSSCSRAFSSARLVPGRMAQVDSGMLGDRCAARVDDQQPRWVVAGQPVQHAHPQHRSGSQRRCVRTARSCRRGRRRCRRRVARRSRTTPSMPRRRWRCTTGCCRPGGSCRCRRGRAWPACSTPRRTTDRWCRSRASRVPGCQQLLAAVDDQRHGGVPVRLDEATVATDEWAG